MLTYNSENAISNSNYTKPIPQATVALIKTATVVVAATGSKRVDFELELQTTNETIKYSIFFEDTKGNEMYTRRLLDKMVAVLQLKDFTYNNRNQITNFTNRKIGLFLNTKDEEYTPKNGSNAGNRAIAVNYDLLDVYHSQSRLLSSEILANATAPVLFDSFLAKLQHKPLNGKANNAQPNQQIQPAKQTDVGVEAFSDDDIPF
jgi:hypothetical protein